MKYIPANFRFFVHFGWCSLVASTQRCNQPNMHGKAADEINDKQQQQNTTDS